MAVADMGGSVVAAPPNAQTAWSTASRELSGLQGLPARHEDLQQQVSTAYARPLCMFGLPMQQQSTTRSRCLLCNKLMFKVCK